MFYKRNVPASGDHSACLYMGKKQHFSLQVLTKEQTCFSWLICSRGVDCYNYRQIMLMTFNVKYPLVGFQLGGRVQPSTQQMV